MSREVALLQTHSTNIYWIPIMSQAKHQKEKQVFLILNKKQKYIFSLKKITYRNKLLKIPKVTVISHCH